MPRIRLVIDPDKVIQDFFLKNYNPEISRAYVTGEVDTELKAVVDAFIEGFFMSVFGLVTEVLTKQLGYKPEQFELVGGVVSRFDRKFVPLQIGIEANYQPVWFHPQDEFVQDLTVRRRKMLEISQSIEVAIITWMADVQYISWRLNTWIRVGEGVFADSHNKQDGVWKAER